MIKIYNSQSEKLEDFVPRVPGEVSMYVCGPTVYNNIHIGNARPVVFFDVVHRYLSHQGFNVHYCSNITDVDDKIINKAIEMGKTEKEISQKYTESFLSDCNSLQISKKTKRLYATDYIEEMYDFIQKLIDNGHAYEKKNSVYFDVNSLDKYAELSHQQINQLIVGARIEENEDKKSPIDFALWKTTNEGIKWQSPWGCGRPGWHTECVTMIASEFAGPIDIHGGGMDLKFPHHDNELAQSYGIGWDTLAKYWMHNGFVEINNEKMSKSLGNFLTLKEAIAQYGTKAVRYWLLSVHYRQPLTFSDEILLEAEEITEKMQNSYEDAYISLKMNNFSVNSTINSEIVIVERDKFIAAMNNDFNTANVITVLHEVMKQINIHLRQGAKSFGVLVQYLTLIEEIESVLMIGIVNKITINEEEREYYQRWKTAKVNKDFAKADEYRTLLAEKNIRVR